MRAVGKNMLDIADEIAAHDGQPCTRQAVEGVMRDRWPKPSPRLADGIARAVGKDVYELFPQLRPKAAKA